MAVKATLCPDIRRFQYLPGSVQFDPGARSVFFSCPCGCGHIGEIDLSEAWVQREPLGAYKLVVGTDGKPTMGKPLLMVLTEEVDRKLITHWRGSLVDGVFDGKA